jgi:hypothetical protein
MTQRKVKREWPSGRRVLKSPALCASFWSAAGSGAPRRLWDPWERSEGVGGKAAPGGAAVQNLAEFERSFALAKLLECGGERSEVPLLGPVGKGRRVLGGKRHLEAPQSKTWRNSGGHSRWRSFWSAVGSEAKYRFWNLWERLEGVGGKAAPEGARTLGHACAVGMEGRDIALRCPGVRTARRSVPTNTRRSFWSAVGSAAK